MAVDGDFRRISIDVPPELYERLGNVFHWGTRNKILTNVLEWTVTQVEKHGPEVLGPLLESPSATARLLKEPSNGNDR